MISDVVSFGLEIPDTWTALLSASTVRPSLGSNVRATIMFGLVTILTSTCSVVKLCKY